MKDILKSYGIKYKAVYSKTMGFIGAVHYNNREIHINYAHLQKARDFNPSDFHILVSAFFHEMGHLLSEELGKYEIFHKAYRVDYLTVEETAQFKRLAFKAERHADLLGEKMQRDFFPGIPYVKGYQTKEDKEYLRNHIRLICEVKGVC
jgi:hypothetical protein